MEEKGTTEEAAALTMMYRISHGSVVDWGGLFLNESIYIVSCDFFFLPDKTHESLFTMTNKLKEK